ncbi:MAG: hypothetical protein VX335_04565 [Pseudomonadota bacterium]|nr:hypothetical protein [Pseudomonadota bacterium]
MTTYKYLKSLQLEEKAITINWILFVITWGIFFGIISGPYLPFFLMIITPLLGIIIPRLIKYIVKKLRLYNLIGKEDTKNNTSTSIDSKNDSILVAVAKFALHAFIHTYIVINSAKILILAYGFSATTTVGLGFISFIALVMLPIFIKEIIALHKVSLANNQHHIHKINRTKAAISFFISLVISAGVFALLTYTTLKVALLIPSAYVSMLFITPLVTLQVLFLVTYLTYVNMSHSDLKVNTTKVVNNIIAFTGITFSLLFGLYKLSCISNIIDISSITSMTVLPGIASAVIPFIFPIVTVFILATVAFLIHKNNVETPEELRPLATNCNNTNSTDIVKNTTEDSANKFANVVISIVNENTVKESKGRKLEPEKI